MANPQSYTRRISANTCPVEYTPIREWILAKVASGTLVFGRDLCRVVKSQYSELFALVKGNNGGTVNIGKLYPILGLSGSCDHCGKPTRYRLCWFSRFCGHSCSLLHPEVRAQVNRTQAERYEGGHHSRDPVVRKKTEASCSKFEGGHQSRDPAVRAKLEKTELERWGGSHLSHPDVKKKTANTMKLRYTYGHSSREPSVRSQMLRSSFGKKVFTSASGVEHVCQGYEPFVLAALDRMASVQSFASDPSKVNRFLYRMTGKAKIHGYQPDIAALTHSGRRLVIEVKCNNTLFNVGVKQNYQVCMAKFKAANLGCRKLSLESGIPHEFWLAYVSDKGDINWVKSPNSRNTSAIKRGNRYST